MIDSNDASNSGDDDDSVCHDVPLQQVSGGLSTISAPKTPSRSYSENSLEHCTDTPMRTETVIKIVSATYGPSEGRRLLTGELCCTPEARIPYTRDVTAFVRALLFVARQKDLDAVMEEAEDESNQTPSSTAWSNSDEEEVDDNESTRISREFVRMSNASGAGVGGMNKNFIALLHGKSMNATFGDPCPGTSKKLKIHYVLYESSTSTMQHRAATSEVHRVSFAEHERVLLRRRVTFFQDDSKLKEAVVKAVKTTAADTMGRSESNLSKQPPVDEEERRMLKLARRMGRSQSIAEFAEATSTIRLCSSPLSLPKAVLPSPSSPVSKEQNVDEKPSGVCPSIPSTSGMLPPTSSPRKWRLRSAVSEIVLPIVLPFLEVRQRVQCQLVCRVWRFVVKDWGVAYQVDVNDTDSFPNISIPFLRGIMAHSFSSLHSLFLNDFSELKKEDLHPAILQFRKLRTFDISRCIEMDNSTMMLIASHLNRTLEVLYIKGLKNVSDEGLMAVCRSCRKLQVLEISNVPITDEGAIAIGENLTKLCALYMRDNYHLTNRSIDVITEKCTKLAQLTLWGCIRLRHLSFEPLGNAGLGCGKLVMLNLWGCHSLMDEAANSLGTMKNLRTLIVSECHKLTDEFVVGLSRSSHQLNHLHLRYCKRITDVGLNAITNSMQNLYSLDLSFCDRISTMALVNLIEIRSDTLSELRLQNCRQLDISMTQPHPFQGGTATGGQDGRTILRVLRVVVNRSSLNILDLRKCGGASVDGGVPDGDPFAVGMNSLEFQQNVPGYFSRPARWNTHVQRRLLDQMMLDEFN